jgi:hypothetical protein
MILFDGDTYQPVQDDLVKHKMRCRDDVVADVCNRLRYEQNRKWHLTTLTESASSKLKNDVKKDYNKLQLGDTNADKRVQIARDTGQFPPSEFNKKAAST